MKLYIVHWAPSTDSEVELVASTMEKAREYLLSKVDPAEHLTAEDLDEYIEEVELDRPAMVHVGNGWLGKP